MATTGPSVKATERPNVIVGPEVGDLGPLYDHFELLDSHLGPLDGYWKSVDDHWKLLYSHSGPLNGH